MAVHPGLCHDLVANPEDRFSHDMVQFIWVFGNYKRVDSVWFP